MKNVGSGFCCVLLLSSLAMNSIAAVKDEQQQEKSFEKSASSVNLSTLDVVQMLIRQGVISEQRAEELIQSVVAEKQAAEIAKDKAKKNTDDESALEAKIVRVPYVPDFIQKQIRDEVRLGLREEVVGDVMSQAQHERWGVPGALPAWINRISLSGDFRLRYQADLFADNNSLINNLYLNMQEVNDARGISLDPDLFYNIEEDRQRLRSRLRLAMNAKVTQGVDVKMRVATGSLNNPTSTNTTLGNSNKPQSLVLDRGYIKITSELKDHTFYGGRMKNPWMGTDLIWDGDLNFDGLAYRHQPLESDNIFDEDRIFDTFFTVGVFPLEEIELSSNDKWLFGVQSGLNWSFNNQDRLDIVFSYYDYQNIEGERNLPNSNLLDYTAPELVGSGNTLFNIANNTVNPDEVLFGLAADYNLANILIRYKLASFAPVNVVLNLDYVENIGYKQSDVLARVGSVNNLYQVYGNNDGAARTAAYQVKLDVGWPSLMQRGNWNASLAYKYIERDAVLDIYTDSDFRGGGTDVEGWVIQGQYAFDDATWLSLKLISADEIDGPPYGQDTIQLDLSSRF